MSANCRRAGTVRLYTECRNLFNHVDTYPTIHRTALEKTMMTSKECLNGIFLMLLPLSYTTWKVSRETKSHCRESSWHQGLQDLGTRGPARKEPLGEGEERVEHFPRNRAAALPKGFLPFGKRKLFRGRRNRRSTLQE